MHILITSICLVFLTTFHVSGQVADGLWYAAYTIKSDSPEDMNETTLLDFDGDNAYLIRLRDIAEGNYSERVIDTLKFDPSTSRLYQNGNAASVLAFEDSMVISVDSLSQSVILKRLPLDSKDVTITRECFRGSYVIPNDNINGSIEFINDSIMIYTGSYGPGGPAIRWHLANYKGYTFLVQHNYFAQVMLVISCSSSGIELMRPSVENAKVILTQSSSSSNQNELLGYWEEVDRSSPPAPPPPNMTAEDLLYRVEIMKDSLTISQYGKPKTYKWDRTKDGRKIYFMNHLFTSVGTWNVLNVTDSTLTLGISRYPNEYEEIQLHKKQKNRR